MPEGPEVRRAADRIARALAGEPAADVWFAFDELQRFRHRLVGREIRRVEPRGKALLIRFDGGWNVYSHNQLYGRWYVRARGSLPRTGRQLRLRIDTDANSALLYSASEIEVLADRELAGHRFLGKLGPDVLDRSTRVDDVVARLRDPRFARRSLAALLLDQGLLCGLGNYLRSEVLFAANVAPELRPRDLGDAAVRDLAEAILTISRRAYRTRGVTNDADAVRRLRELGATRREYRHFVFGRDGKPCPDCGMPIEKVELAGRRLYRCAICQAPDALRR